MECAMVAKGMQVELQALALHQPLVRHIVNDDMCEIRLPGHRTDRGELWRCETNHVQRSGMARWHSFQHSRFRTFRRNRCRAKLRQTRNISLCHDLDSSRFVRIQSQTRCGTVAR